MKIAIVGGGASGLYCACLLKRANPSLEITIFEKEEKCGRKILMSGNGRGNISNLHMEKNWYNNDFAYKIAQNHSPQALMRQFSQLGLLCYADDQGRVYPHSETANSVLDCLRMWNQMHHVAEITKAEISQIKTINQGYQLGNLESIGHFDIVIIACGTSAGYGRKSNEASLEQSLKKIGYLFTNKYPSLSPLFIEENIRSLSGLRLNVEAKLLIQDKEVYSNTGEILFKDDNLSGILIFELSTFYARAMVNKTVSKAVVTLDLFPEYTQEALFDYLLQRKKTMAQFDILEFWTGVFNRAIGNFIIKSLHIDKSKQIQDLSMEDLQRLCKLCKTLSFTIDTDKVSNNFQVYCGGLDLTNLLPQSLQSKLHKNLYFLGEFLDVDGICGGYNLHFAFASAYFAASEILGDKYV